MNNENEERERKEKEERKKRQNLYFFSMWFIFLVLLLIISSLVYLTTNLLFNSSLISICAASTLFFLLVLLTFILAWQQVPEKREWIIELLGGYFSTWKPGLHFIFPYLGLMTINSKVFMGEQQLKLFLNKNVKTGFGAGHVDFTDTAAPVQVIVYFKVVDAYKAAYEIGDIFRGIADKMESAVRSYLGQFSVDEVIKFKPRLGLAEIMNGDPDVVECLKKGKALKSIKAEDTQLYKDILNDWGVEVKSLAITDIEVPSEVTKIREEVLKATKEAQVALHKMRATITNAKANKKALVLTGEGYRSQIKSVADDLKEGANDGLGSTRAAEFLMTNRKWEAVRPTDKTLITPGTGPDIASLGASFGVGQKAGQEIDGKKSAIKGSGISEEGGEK